MKKSSPGNSCFVGIFLGMMLKSVTNFFITWRWLVHLLRGLQIMIIHQVFCDVEGGHIPLVLKDVLVILFYPPKMADSFRRNEPIGLDIFLKWEETTNKVERVVNGGGGWGIFSKEI